MYVQSWYLNNRLGDNLMILYRITFINTLKEQRQRTEFAYNLWSPTFHKIEFEVKIYFFFKFVTWSDIWIPEEELFFFFCTQLWSSHAGVLWGSWTEEEEFFFFFYIHRMGGVTLCLRNTIDQLNHRLWYLDRRRRIFFLLLHTQDGGRKNILLLSTRKSLPPQTRQQNKKKFSTSL